MQKKRLSKALAAAGVASRRQCEELIFEGKIKVNKRVVKIPQTLVDWDKDRIDLDSIRILKEESKVYYMFNKPRGFVCSNNKEKHKKIVFDFFSHKLRLFTAGRLDKNTTGLLIITNDGAFANKLIHPSQNIQKEYLVKIPMIISDGQLQMIKDGMRIEGVFVKPLRVIKVRRGTLKIVIMEGKKREVRQLVERAELSVKELTRIRIGNLSLGNLPLGEKRLLNDSEKEALFS